jgi:hypothetical protein
MDFRPVGVGKSVPRPDESCKKPNEPDAKVGAFCGEKMPQPPPQPHEK